MHYLNFRIYSQIFVISLFSAFTYPIYGQHWKPNKPIRLIVGFAPGGAADVVSRIISEQLSIALGQQVLTDNRIGANGLIGYEILSKSTPDGYTIGTLGDSSTLIPYLYKNSKIDPRTSFLPISMIASQPLVIAINASVKAINLQEFITLARNRPNTYSFGSSGNGHPQHLTGELIKKIGKFEMTHIPYKGGGQAVIDLVGGQIQAAVLGSSPVIPHYRTGKVRILAVTTKKRSTILPEIPTLSESGILGIDVSQWQSLIAPANTPKLIINRFNLEIAKALARPTTRDKLGSLGFEVNSSSPEELATVIRNTMDRWEPLVKELKLELE